MLCNLKSLVSEYLFDLYGEMSPRETSEDFNKTFTAMRDFLAWEEGRSKNTPPSGIFYQGSTDTLTGPVSRKAQLQILDEANR